MKSHAEIVEEVSSYAWRVSPLSTAVAFSAIDGENPRFQSAKHLKIVSDAIVDAVNGTGPKLIIISMPPRHGKSTLVSRWTPEWALSCYPEATVGMCAYGAEFAQAWGRQVRNQIKNHSPATGVNLAEDSKKAAVWHTDEGGMMWSAGVRGAITGRGADLLIIDDPIKNDQEAYSLTERDSLWEWWMTTALTRTYPHSVIIVVMTRWHTDDIVGRLLSTEYPGDPTKWRYIEFPALWDSAKPDIMGRAKGDALWPAMYPAEWLIANRKNGMSEESWLSLFQQKPLNRTGIGACYHNFEEAVNVKEIARDPRLPLIWSLDFNVNPMSAVIAQMREAFGPNSHLTNEKLTTFEVLDEIVLPNSNTPEMCGEFFERYTAMSKGRKPEVHVYGDATASRRDTRGYESDWQIIYNFLDQRQIPYKNFVAGSDPAVRDRVAAMNNALLQPDGVIGLYMTSRCKQLILDLKEVRWKRDKSGNSTSQLDKSDANRTHISDALGYAVEKKFALWGGGKYI